MKSRDYLAVAGLFLRRIAVSGLALLIVTGAVCWLGGWRTFHAWGGLIRAGVAAIVVGAVTASTAMGIVNDPGYQSLRSIRRDSVRAYHTGDRDYLDGAPASSRRSSSPVAG